MDIDAVQKQMRNLATIVETDLVVVSYGRGSPQRK